MRSLVESGVRFESTKNGKPRSALGAGSSASWLALADTYADRAAAAGFVLSMIFLAAAAVYAFSLSGAAKALYSEAFALADRAAFDAGYQLRDLALDGAKNTRQTALLKALKLPYQGSSLFYDAAAARKALLSIGWIETAEVRRILPSRLEVTVTERTPFARWENAAGEVQVIGGDGRILGPDPEGRFGALPYFAGEGAPAEAASFEEAIQDCEALKGRILRAELVAERFWTVKIESGPMLKLPHKVTPLTLERLGSLLTSPKIALLSLDTIDLRLSNRTILQLQEPTVSNRDRAIALLASPPQASQAPERNKAL